MEEKGQPIIAIDGEIEKTGEADGGNTLTHDKVNVVGSSDDKDPPTNL